MRMIFVKTALRVRMQPVKTSTSLRKSYIFWGSLPQTPMFLALDKLGQSKILVMFWEKVRVEQEFELKMHKIINFVIRPLSGSTLPLKNKIVWC